MKNVLIGLLFASLWASASVATKIGLESAPPLIIANARFFLAGIIMLFVAHIINRNPLPKTEDWKPLMIYGILNVTVYLGAFVYAIREVSPGIGTLGVATNPLIISVLSSVWFRKKININIWIGLFIGMIGIAFATYPLLISSTTTPRGLLILTLSMVSYSVGTVYYSNRTWTLPRLVINGWQVFLGGLLLVPLTLIMSDFEHIKLDTTYWFTVLWLAIPVSIGAVQLWLYLLSIDAVKAALWLFLCPIFGFLYANLILNEPITLYTYIGTGLVILGLYIGQQSSLNGKALNEVNPSKRGT